MSASLPEFNRGAIRPMECLRGGWELVKGDYWLFLGITVVGILVGSVVPLGILMGPMMCGIYMCYLRRMRGEQIEFGQLFKGFDYFGESVIATLIQAVPIVVLIAPIYIVFFIGMSTLAPERRSGRRTVSDPSSLITFLIVMGVVFLVVMLIIMALSVLFVFSYPLIVDRKLSGVDAVKTSARAIFGNIGGAAGLMFLNVLLGIVGLLFCYVGAFLWMPVGLAAWAIAYRQVFPAQQEFNGGI
ncbi:MAG: hypothetical protein WCF57_12875 [Pyrinomonadaceae bacterium]